MVRNRYKRFVPVLAIAVATASMVLFASASSAKPPTVFINGDSIATYTFAPRTLEINRGETVHWSWDSNGPHNVTFKKLDKTSKTGASEKFRLKFKKSGTYKYLCTIHDFRGKIIVK